MGGNRGEEAGRRHGRDEPDDEPWPAFRGQHQRVLEVEHRAEDQEGKHGGDRQRANHAGGDHRIGRRAQRTQERQSHRRQNQYDGTSVIERA